MAVQGTIAERLKKRKATTRGTGGQLGQEDIQNLSATKGLESAPLTPAGAAGIGASPDQAKMVGDARQKRAALQQAMDPEDTLTGRIRRAQRRTEETGAETGIREKSQSLQALKGLGDRVQDMVTRHMAPEGDVEAAALTLSEEATALAPNVQAALMAYAAAPKDMTAMIAAATAMGLDPKDPELAAKLTSNLSAEVREGNIANQIQDTVDVSQLISGLEEGEDGLDIHALLGIEVGKITSVDELQQAVQNAYEQEFTRTEKLKDIATNPSSSRQQRLDAVEELRNLGAVGVRATEDETRELAESVEAGDTVSFMGKEYEADKLLSDETVEGLVQEFINASPEVREDMLKKEPDFFGYIAEHEAALQGALTESEVEATEFATIQSDNNALQSTPVGDIPKELMEALIPGYGDFSTDRYEEPALVGMLGKGSSLDETQKASLMQNLLELQKNDPKLLKSFAKATPDRIKQLGVYASPTIKDAAGNDVPNPAYEKWKNYKEFRQRWTRIESLDKKSPSYLKDLAVILTGDERADPDAMKKQLQKNKLMGIKSPGMLFNIFSGDKGDPSVYLGKYGRWTSPDSIMSGSTYKDGIGDFLADPTNAIAPTYTESQVHLNKKYGKFLEDGAIDWKEWNAIQNSDPDWKTRAEGYKKERGSMDLKAMQALLGSSDKTVKERIEASNFSWAASNQDLKGLVSTFFTKKDEKMMYDPFTRHKGDPIKIKKLIAALEKMQGKKTSFDIGMNDTSIKHFVTKWKETLKNVEEQRKAGPYKVPAGGYDVKKNDEGSGNVIGGLTAVAKKGGGDAAKGIKHEAKKLDPSNW